MGLFGGGTVPVLGVDISGGSVKVLELGKSGSAMRVAAYGIAPIPPDAIVDKVIQNPEAVGESIVKAVQRSGSSLKHAAAAVSGSNVFTRTIQVAADIPESELEGQIELEAEQYFPVSLEEVNMDFNVLGPAPDGPDRNEVLIVAARSDTVDNRVAALEHAGLLPKVIDIEAFAIENAIAMMMAEEYGQVEGQEKQVVAVVDVGSVATGFSVLHGDRIVYNRDEAFGGNQLTENIQQTFGISYEEAEAAKKQGGLPDNYETEVLEPFKHTMAQQISRSIQFFYSSSHITNIDFLLLAGGTSATPGVAEAVEEHVSIPTSVANPFANMSTAARISRERLNGDAPSLLVCCGLALRSFD